MVYIFTILYTFYRYKEKSLLYDRMQWYASKSLICLIFTVSLNHIIFSCA